MGIVKISEELHDAAKYVSKAMSRSINSQAEHWMRIGKLVEENPTFTYAEVMRTFFEQAKFQIQEPDYASENA